MKIVLFGHQNLRIESIKFLYDKHQIVQVFTHPLDMDKNENIWYESIKKILVKKAKLTDLDYREPR